MPKRHQRGWPDPALADQFVECLQVCFLLVQHVADVVGVLYLGRLVEEAPRDKLFSDPKHPYTRMLFEAAPRMDMIGRETEPPKGEIPDAINPPSGCVYHPRCPLAFDKCKLEAPLIRDVGETRVACHAVSG